MIKYISENPRFENSQVKEKEHFSGSLVESMKVHWNASQAHPILKKSNSYNEERSSSRVKEEGEEKEGRMKGKCIPRKKRSGSSKEVPSYRYGEE
ncbi:protein SOSEKI 2-like [Prosopis cineraria]|uniref:protein SOSEKI 2-like n=1 Tax=Prosopis cineraria TaxID=364024 RepID=UPI00241028FB|nr:protein SOSEKI 2-like [Prosopis cineraria]